MMKNMTKKTLIAGLAALVLWPLAAAGNGLDLNGLGSRAQGMGGAFVGVADDFSAVFWNPAGAGAFRQTLFGFAAADLAPRMTYRYHSEGPSVDARTKISHYLSFLAGYYRPVGSKVVLGLGIGTPSAQGALWSGADFASVSNGVSYDRSDRIYRFCISPMAAVRLGKAVSVGAALDVNYGSLSLKKWGGFAVLGGLPADTGQYEETLNGWGIGATLGVLLKPVDRLTIGLTLRTPSTLTLRGGASLSLLSAYGLPARSDIKSRITWPLRIAGGVSFRPVERLLLSADLHWTGWSKLDRITTEILEPAWAELGANTEAVRHLEWRNALQVRIGAEYRAGGSTSLRAGYHRDPAPGPDSRLDVLLTTFTHDVFSVGIGRSFGGLQLDLSLEYMAARERRIVSAIFSSSTFAGHAVVPSVSASYRF